MIMLISAGWLPAIHASVAGLPRSNVGDHPDPPPQMQHNIAPTLRHRLREDVIVRARSILGGLLTSANDRAVSAAGVDISRRMRRATRKQRE